MYTPFRRFFAFSVPAVCLSSAAVSSAAATEFPKFQVYPSGCGEAVLVDEQMSRRPWVLLEIASVEARPVAEGQRTPLLVTARVCAAIGADAEVGSTVQRLCNSGLFLEPARVACHFPIGSLYWMHPDEELPKLWNFDSEGEFIKAAEALPDGNPWKQAAAVVREHMAFGREAEAFLRAIQQDDAAEVKRMLDAGFDPTRRDAYVEDGSPWALVLHYCCLGGSQNETDYMQMLIDAGVDINQPALWGETPLCYAAEYGLGDLLRLLLAHGADATRRDKGGNTALHAAVEARPATDMPHEGAPEECERRCRELLAGYAENIRTLVAAGADVNAVNDAGETPLYLAVQRKEPALVEALLEKGADVSRRYAAGDTVLHILVRRQPPLFSVSESQPARMREAHEYWNRSMRERYQATLRALLAAGADPHAANDAGETPLSLAEKSGNAELVRMLRGEANGS